ncbi:MAG: ATP-dependent helicase [Planctomycetota bacterium]|jgi:DNA helicase-2/ATP-dependent DNA helicase PcrA
MLNKEQYDQLTPAQKTATFHKDGPLLVLAGPGSGKTRVITHRIGALIDSGVNPYNICAITFTNKAANEMCQRTIALGTARGVHISTFHSLCVRILRQYSNDIDIHPNFSIYDDTNQVRCIKQATKDCQLDTTNFSPSRMLEAVSTLKNKLLTAEFFESQADDFFTSSLAKIYLQYQKILKQHNALDFDDLLMKTALLLKSNADILSQIGNRFKYLLIDEYQDTNHAQYAIAKAIASVHSNICATGDPDQSIYRWRGADIGNILAFESDWPNTTVVKLEENFRSISNILKIADSLISHNIKRKPKKLVPIRPDGKDIVINSFEDEHEEALNIARQIKSFMNSEVSLCQTAVFYRVNSMSRVLEEAFIQNQIPYQIVRGIEFYGRKEIRDLLSYLRIIINPDDEIALLRIINTPPRGIGKITIDKVKAYAQANSISLYDALKKAKLISTLSNAAQSRVDAFANMIEQFKKDSGGKVVQLAERVFAESGLEQYLSSCGAEGMDAIENVKELINAAAQYDQTTDEPSVTDYLQQISLFSDTDTYDTTCERVTLMTLHAAKGLEFDNVFIIGLENGLLPHERSLYDEDETEEERRLFFVGITRAKNNLNISYSRYRTVRGQLLRTIPSQFLYELDADFDNALKLNQCSNDGLTLDTDSSQIPPAFAKGQLVRHKQFGNGKVVKFNDMGANSTIVITFNTGQTKALMLKYTNLIKL